MDALNFRIAPDAAKYLRDLLRAGTSEPLILTIVPTSQPTILDVDASEKVTGQEAELLAKEYLKTIPLPLELRWSVGATRKSRVPVEDIVVVDGIECFFPSEVRLAITGRVLRLAKGDLAFDPKLEAPKA